MTPLIYEPLNAERKELRLLRLPYGMTGEDLGIKMFITWLGSQPEYLAVSYVWGDPDDKVVVGVGRCQVCVPRNLRDALTNWSRYANKISRDVYLWADAICINQADLQEKSSQILLMNEIFTQATATVVWLGDSLSEHQHAFEAIKNYSTLSLTNSLRSFDVNTLMDDTPEAEHVRGLISPIDVGVGQSSDIKLQSISQFLGHPWWQRVWTFQEAALARQLIFSTGSNVLYRNDFSDFTFILILRYELLRSDPQAGTISAAIKTIVSHLTVVNEQLKAGGMYDRPLLKMLDMSSMGQRRCLDPRDHILGLTGMINNDDEALGALAKLSYNQTDVDIFTAAAARLLMTHGVEILEYTWARTFAKSGGELAQDPTNGSDLPSWVPDWSARFVNPLQGALTIRKETFFSASKSFLVSKESNLSIDGSSLYVSGVWVDRISVIAPILTRMENITTFIPWLKQTWQPWISRCLALLSDSPSSSISYPTFRDRFHAITRTAMIDCTGVQQALRGSRRIDLAKDESMLDDILDTYRAITDPSVMKVITPQARSVLERLKTDPWMVFVTEQGRVGLGRPDCVVGDQVCILAGASTACVFRHAAGLPDRVDEDERPRYRLIGEAYLHEMMDGQCQPEGPLTRFEVV